MGPLALKPTEQARPNLSLYRQQFEFLTSNAHQKAFVAGRGSGKSFVQMADLILRAKPDRRYMVGGPTYGMLADGPIPTFLRIARGLGRLGVKDSTSASERSGFNASNPCAYLSNGAVIIFRSADNPQRFRGPNLSGVAIDEASQIAEEAMQLVSMCLRDEAPDLLSIGELGWITCCYTPRGTSHWTYKQFARPDEHGRNCEQAGWIPPLNTYHVMAKTTDNPFLPSDFYSTMRAKVGPIMASQELEGRYTDIEGAIYKREWFRYYSLDNGGNYSGPRVEKNGVLVPDGVQRSCLLKDCRVFLTVDLATSLKESADYTVIQVWADDRYGNMLLVDMVRQRMEGPDIIPRAKALAQKYSAVFVGFESVGMQLAFVQAAKRQGMTVKELHADRDKVSRAIPATVRMEAGQIWFPTHAPWLADLKDELLHFPPVDETGKEIAGMHDDMCDALAYAALEMVSLYAIAEAKKPGGMISPGPLSGLYA
jgi:predicted phage terminase large subunit-like protein